MEIVRITPLSILATPITGCYGDSVTGKSEDIILCNTDDDDCGWGETWAD